MYKIQYSIESIEDKYLYFAGLWSIWFDREAGTMVKSFAVITCDPIGSLAQIHDRQPVILDKAERRVWMNGKSSLPELMNVLKPYNPASLRITEYSRKELLVKRVKKRDDDDLLFN